MTGPAGEPAARRPRPGRAPAPNRPGGPADRGAPRRPRRDRRSGPARVAVAAGFALLYGWDLVEAIAALAALLGFAAAAGHPLNSYAWLVLGTGILVPPVAYATALLVGRARGPLMLAAVLGAGLATSAALGLTVGALLRA